jgi:hypothetical protein
MHYSTGLHPVLRCPSLSGSRLLRFLVIGRIRAELKNPEVVQFIEV